MLKKNKPQTKNKDKVNILKVDFNKNNKLENFLTEDTVDTVKNTLNTSKAPKNTSKAFKYDISSQSISFRKFEDIQDWIEGKFYWACSECPDIVCHLKDLTKFSKQNKKKNENEDENKDENEDEKLTFSFSYMDYITLHYLDSFIAENHIPYIYLANENNWKAMNSYYLTSGFISYDAELVKFKKQLAQLKSDFLKYANSTDNPFKGKINFDVECSCFVTAVDVDTYCKSFAFKVDILAWPVVD